MMACVTGDKTVFLTLGNPTGGATLAGADRRSVAQSGQRQQRGNG